MLEFGVNLLLAAAILSALPRLRRSARRLLPSALLVAVGIQLLNNTVGRLFIVQAEGRPAYRPLILLGSAIAATARYRTATDMGLRRSEGDRQPDGVGEPHGAVRPEPR